VLSLVERRQDPSDRRVARVYLTPAGKKLAEAVNDRVVPANTAFLEGMTDTEVAELKRLLKQL
jgi:DNA-binding MarR family transcriptional regulator